MKRVEAPPIGLRELRWLVAAVSLRATARDPLLVLRHQCSSRLWGQSSETVRNRQVHVAAVLLFHCNNFDNVNYAFCSKSIDNSVSVLRLSRYSEVDLVAVGQIAVARHVRKNFACEARTHKTTKERIDSLGQPCVVQSQMLNVCLRLRADVEATPPRWSHYARTTRLVSFRSCSYCASSSAEPSSEIPY